MIRKLGRIGVRPRRKGVRIVTPDSDVGPEPEVVAAALAADQIDLTRQLHEQAAEGVAATLVRLQQRSQEAARSMPELEPYLTAYFEAAGTSLMQHTLEVLHSPPRYPSRRPDPPPRPAGRFSICRLIPVRVRQEQPDGPV